MTETPGTATDVLVLGAGILGAALSYHLARRKDRSVQLLDPGPGDRQATRRSAGILTVQGWDTWDLGLVRASAAEYRAIAEWRGRSEFETNGGLRVARTPEGVAWLERVHGVLQRSGVESQLLGPEGTGRLLPAGSLEDVRSALFTPEDAVCSPATLTADYLRSAARAGAEVRLGAAPGPIRWTDGRWSTGGRPRRGPDAARAVGGSGRTGGQSRPRPADGSVHPGRSLGRRR